MLGDIILDLSIISKIPKKGRIKRDNSGKISLEKEWVFQPVTRVVYGNNRDTAINDINTVKVEAFEKSNDIMDNKFFNIYKLKESPTESEIEAHNKKVEEITELSQSLLNSIKGIENLKGTYSDDATSVSKLDRIIHEINNKAMEMKSKLDTSHHKFINQKRKKNYMRSPSEDSYRQEQERQSRHILHYGDDTDEEQESDEGGVEEVKDFK